MNCFLCLLGVQARSVYVCLYVMPHIRRDPGHRQRRLVLELIYMN